MLFIRSVSEFVTELLQHGDKNFPFLSGHVQGLVCLVGKKRILFDFIFERRTPEYIGMKQECPSFYLYPLSVILFPAYLSGSHTNERSLVVVVFSQTVGQIDQDIVPQK